MKRRCCVYESKGMAEAALLKEKSEVKKKSPTKRRSRRRVFNRNPAVNALLEEEEESVDNYDDLADFIDPTPDTSLENVHFRL